MMSWIKDLFGGSSASKESGLTPATGLQKLEETADMLHKKIAHTESLIEEQEKIIKANVNTNKKKALDALKRKKRYEEQVKQAEATLTGIENQKEVLENAKTNTAIMQTMSQTSKILKQEHNNMDMGKLEDIVDDIREQQEIAKEISEVIANTGAQKAHDDDELLKELEDMGQRQLDEKLLQTDVTPTALPEIPKAMPAEKAPSASTSHAKKADDELEELKQWAS